MIKGAELLPNCSLLVVKGAEGSELLPKWSLLVPHSGVRSDGRIDLPFGCLHVGQIERSLSDPPDWVISNFSPPPPPRTSHTM